MIISSSIVSYRPSRWCSRLRRGTNCCPEHNLIEPFLLFFKKGVKYYRKAEVYLILPRNNLDSSLSMKTCKNSTSPGGFRPLRIDHGYILKKGHFDDERCYLTLGFGRLYFVLSYQITSTIFNFIDWFSLK